MSGVVKKLGIDCVNRIKYEKSEEFEESLFADVYDRAIKLTSLIIEANIKEEAELIDDSFCTEERYNNIISFWGERGMGKSSAMLSFALFLKNYTHQNTDRFQLSTTKKPEFHVLPRIDAAMLVKGENLLDIILAKMWSAFDERVHISIGHESRFQDTKTRFGDVKKSYEAYRKAVDGKEENFNMTSVRQLKELSKCLNLREDFKKLVSSYLSCMTNGRGETFFLVLTIDDLDVAMDDVNNILEQIRLFLMIPKVIVLITADYGRLYLDCNRSFSSKLICSSNIEQREKDQIRSYTEKYLAKIFPGNMRVHMPRINVVGGVDYEVRLPKESGLLSTVNSNEKLDEKRMLFILLAKYTKIMMYPHNNHRHLLQKSSLRTIVNELYELESMNKLEEPERFKTACRWIQTALIDYGRTITDSDAYDCVQNLLKENGNSIHEAIAEVLTGLPGRTLQTEAEEIGYGRILKLLMEIKDNKYRELVDFVLVLYSTQLAEAFYDRSAGKDFRALYVNGIFYSSVEAATKKAGNRKENTETDKLPSSSLQMKLLIPKINQIKHYFCENLAMIYNTFKLAMLSEWNLWDEEKSDYVKFTAREENAEAEDEMPSLSSDKDREENQQPAKGTGKKIILNMPEVAYSKVSLEILLWNSLSYEECLKGFCRNIYRTLCEIKGIRIIEDRMKRDIEEIALKNIFRLKAYQKWKSEYQVAEIDSLLPWQSAEVMLRLVKEAGRVQVKVSDTNLLDRILSLQIQQVNTVIAELKKIENYYKPVFAGGKTYSAVLEAFIRDIKPYDIKGKQIGQSSEKSIGSDTSI